MHPLLDTQMLEALRNSVNTITAKILLGLLVLSFAVWGISDVFTGRTDTVVATVGEAEIGAQDYARAVSDRLQAFQRQTGRAVTLSEARQLGLDQVVLAQLTTREALNEEARALGLSASGEAVRDAISEAPSFQNALGTFDRETYERRVRYRGQTISEFETDVREDLARESLLQAIGSGTSAPRALAETLYRHRNEERVFEYVALAAEDAPDPGEPTEEQVVAYHQDNADKFTAPEYRSLSFAWLTAEALAEEIEISEDDVRESYEARIGEFTRAATRTLDQLLFATEEAANAAKDEIAAGASFASIVEAQGSNRQDSSLGQVAREELPNALADAAFGADAPGIVGPVKTAFGWTLLNIRAVAEESVQPFEDVEERVRRDLQLIAARARLGEESVALDDELAGGAALKEAAALTATTYAKIESIDATGRDPEGNRPEALPPIRELLERAFEAKTSDEPQVVEIDGGSFFAVQVNEVTPAALRPLDTVREDVVSAWQLDQRVAALADLAATYRDKIEEGGSLDDIAAENDLELRDTGAIRRSARVRGVPEAVLEQIFSAEPGAMITAEGEAGQYLLGQLKEIVSVEPEKLEQEIDRASEGYAAQLAQDIVQSFSRTAQERNETLLHTRVIDATLSDLGQRY